MPFDLAERNSGLLCGTSLVFPLWLCFSRHYYLDKRWHLAAQWAFLCSFGLVHLKVVYRPVERAIWTSSFKARLQMQRDPKWKFRNFWVKFSRLDLGGGGVFQHGIFIEWLVLVNIPPAVHTWGFFGYNSGEPLKHMPSNPRPMRQTHPAASFPLGCEKILTKLVIISRVQKQSNEVRILKTDFRVKMSH